ncbi:unannotated protein [freshwater metagenome]|uniref:Unannotated protein n=1 Tax=freshwater metagenome TaxID=449393 RepID=A0A6J7VVW3_9ZZZZ|nr:hypothetical protein [Actinomycetota bacterium]MTA70594.1 hypothetical protein [Actinomycetota bacterium]
MSATTATKPLIQGPGLKAPGIVVMQFFFIALFTLIELVFRSGVGIVTGIAICAALYGGLRFGRPGTTYVSVVTPPIAFAVSLFALTLIFDGFKPSRVGIDVIAGLASEAPFLIISALYGWFIYFNEKAKTRPSRKKSA